MKTASLLRPPIRHYCGLTRPKDCLCRQLAELDREEARWHDDPDYGWPGTTPADESVDSVIAISAALILFLSVVALVAGLGLLLYLVWSR